MRWNKSLILIMACLAIVLLLPLQTFAQAAYAWGFNGAGQLGIGTSVNSNVPVLVNGLSNGVTVVTGGGQYSMTLQNGALLSWGANNFLELGYVNGQPFPQAVPGFSTGVTSMAGGVSHTLAIQNGSLYTWGDNGSGELGRSGQFPQVPSAQPAISNGVTGAAAGNAFSLAIQNGAVLSFGLNSIGQLGLGTTGTFNSTPTVIPSLASGVTKIAAKYNFAAAIQNGALFAWGDNFNGQLGNGTNTNSSSPVPVTGLTSSVADIALGINHSLALRNGVVYAWGSNVGGMLGTGQFTPSTNVPIVVPGLPSNVINIEAAYDSSYALTADHRLFVWGQNSLGELGDGTFNVSYTPEEIFAPNGLSFTDLSAGGNHVLAILSISAVPEPSSILMLGSVAFVGVVGALRYRRKLRFGNYR